MSRSVVMVKVPTAEGRNVRIGKDGAGGGGSRRVADGSRHEKEEVEVTDWQKVFGEEDAGRVREMVRSLKRYSKAERLVAESVDGSPGCCCDDLVEEFEFEEAAEQEREFEEEERELERFKAECRKVEKKYGLGPTIWE